MFAREGEAQMHELDEVIDRLDQLILLFRAAFDEEIGAYRDQLRSDPVVDAILDWLGSDPIASGDLKRAVAKSADVSEKTVQRALLMLADRGVIRAHGQGPSTTYRSVGVL